MRLIDADALQKEHMKYNDGKRLMLVDVAPTIDAVEVVRCKDCEFYEPFTPSIGRCHEDIVTLVKNPTDYCSFGERKEDNER